MTSMILGEEILRMDARGRVRTTAERREKILEEFERSGLSGAKFAEMAGIKYQTFATWVQRRNKRRKPGDATNIAGKPRWVEAVLEKPVSSGSCAGPLTIRLPGGATLELKDTRQVELVVTLLRALQTSSPC